MDLNSTEDLEILKNRLSGVSLRKILKEKNVTKYRLSKDLGISYQTIMNWINGAYKPREENVIRLAKYLGIVKPDRATILELKARAADLQKQIDRLESGNPN